MRKLGRLLRRLLTAVSLLLFVAVLAAWVRGYWNSDSWRVTRESMGATGWRRATRHVEWGGGEVGVFQLSEYADAEQGRVKGKTPGVRWEMDFAHHSPTLVGREYARLAADGKRLFRWPGWTWNRGGVLLGRVEVRGPILGGVGDGPSECHFLAFPCWMAAVVFGALPSWRSFVWWRGVRRRRVALREGRCTVCGYDLRASPQRCPECGTAVGGEVSPRSHGGHGEEGGEEPPMNADLHR